MTNSMRNIYLAAAATIALAACGEQASAPQAPADDAAPGEISLDAAAERYVRLALEFGTYDTDYVDAYLGPEALRAEEPRSLEALRTEAETLYGALSSIAQNAEGEDARRARNLTKILRAALMRMRLYEMDIPDFNDEALAIYDAVVPEYDWAAFDRVLAEIDALLPGDAPLSERVDAFRQSLAIPPDRLDAVFKAAIDECRRRTLAHIDLPEGENFRIEYVTDKTWSGYNWYQGDYQSLIQVNTDFPTIIDRAVDLGCHEGYPGHHTWNTLVERELVEKRGWIEFTVYPLFAPAALIGEGSGNYGIELAFPGSEKIAFEREVLFPLAGLDPAQAETLERLNALQARLSHAGNAIARDYLDGEISRDEAIELQQRYALTSRERAEQRIRFVEQYRAYVINYNLGRDIVRDYIERGNDTPEERWAAFERMLTELVTASEMQGE